MIIDYVKWLFVFAKVGKRGAKAGFSVKLKYFEIKKGLSLVVCFVIISNK